MSLAISCGFRESGVTSVNKRVIIAIRCSIRLEVPLGDSDRIMVSPEYVRYLVEVANEKMDANRKRSERFFALLQSNGFNSNGSLNAADVSVCEDGFACDNDVVVKVGDGDELDKKNVESESSSGICIV